MTVTVALELIAIGGIREDFVTGGMLEIAIDGTLETVEQKNALSGPALLSMLVIAEAGQKLGFVLYSLAPDGNFSGLRTIPGLDVLHGTVLFQAHHLAAREALTQAPADQTPVFVMNAPDLMPQIAIDGTLEIAIGGQ